MVWFLRLWFLVWFSFILVPRCLLAPFTCFETHWIFKFSFFLDFALKLLKSDSPKWETEWSDFFRLIKFNYQQWASWSSTCVDDRYSILKNNLMSRHFTARSRSVLFESLNNSADWGPAGHRQIQFHRGIGQIVTHLEQARTHVPIYSTNGVLTNFDCSMVCEQPSFGSSRLSWPFKSQLVRTAKYWN
jgi:hypothetical protein